MSHKLREHLIERGLIRGGEVAERLGMTPIAVDWHGTTVTCYPVVELDALAAVVNAEHDDD